VKEILCISPESVADGYRRLGRAVVTRGTPFEVEMDSEDPLSLAVISRPEIQVGVRRFRFLGLPMLTHFSNIQIQPGVFFRCFNLLGVLQVHAVVRHLDGKKRIEPHYISHPLLKFLHRFLDKRRFLLDGDDR
jgi:hypothetical protein